MTRSEIKSRIPILQAWLEQEAIQSLYMFNTRSEWEDYVIEKPPDIFNPSLEWRLKPPQPPKPREWWIVIESMANKCSAYVDRPFAYYDAAAHQPPRSVVHVREVLSPKGWPYTSDPTFPNA